MAKITQRFETHSDGTVWAVLVYCDGSESAPIQVPCQDCKGDGGSGPGTPTDPDIPVTAWCDTANWLANGMKNSLGDWTEWIQSNLPLDFQAAVYLIQVLHLPATELVRVLAYLTAQRANMETVIWSMDNSLCCSLEQEVVCAAYKALALTGGVINASFLAAWKTQLQAAPVVTDRCGVEGWQAIAAYVSLLSLQKWQEYAVGFTPDTAGFGIGCDCGEIATCDETALYFPFNNGVTEGYSILSGTQNAGYIGGLPIPSGGFPEYGIPGVADGTSRGAYILLALNVKIARLSVTFRFRRFSGSLSGVGHLLYCYDADNQLMFGKVLGGSTTSQQDTDLTMNFDISASGACVHHGVLAVNFASSDPAIQYIQVLEAQTYLTLD